MALSRDGKTLNRFLVSLKKNKEVKMENRMKIVLPLLLMAFISCRQSDHFPGPDTVGRPEASIFAGMAEMGMKSGEDNYKHNQFIPDRSVIRVVNTVNYGIPDFTDGAGYEEYIYTKEGVAWDDNDFNFLPLKKGTSFGDIDRVDYDGGFDWDKIVPTSTAFVFEAACYPMVYKYFDAITTDQSVEENFWSADLLLAHTRQPFNGRYDLLKLRFWHVFSMIRIHVDLPIASPDADSGFPADRETDRTVEKVFLTGMYVTYDTRYTESIANYGRRTVVGTDRGGRQDIIMYRLPGKDDVITGSDGRQYQRCVFAAIVPTQSIRTGATLLKLDIKTIVGFEDGTMGSQKVETKTYLFKPDVPIDMEQGKITVLDLTSDGTTSSPILLNAEIKPWDNAYTEVDLTPR